ncbi:hypothetical protein HF086_015215 [Spodoptera exigua]|uniref:THAP-type domain-containing protein n=1 Tax=Spodoptera exigua TaxID=7107 RepID=A0A922SKK5_SPOEX|nr:hypothetical protein HF086_015215 [Spodoptera exigua]
MPSCVVKSCRNHSGSIKKSQGITFHRFPSANDAWRNDWIKIIRESRHENNWNPSKSSVICSIHFEKHCLYSTKGGLLRVVAYAVPTKFLSDTSAVQELPTDVFSSSVSDKSSLVIEGVATVSGQQKKIEQPFSQNVTTTLTQSSSVVEGISVQESTLQQSCLLNTTSSLQNESPETVISGVELDQPLSLLCTPRKRRMKEDLMKMRALVQNQKRKIKVLNQKVRRLQDRNKSLKGILKTLKEENYVDSDLFNRLNEDITLAKWYGHLNAEPGLTEESFQALKAKAQISEHRPLCTLLFDKVAIRAQKIWDGKKYIDLEDMGSGVAEGAPLASQALVFLLVGINHRFKLPLGYFLSNSIRGEQKANLIKLCLLKCFEADIDVVALTCDGHQTNFNALELLGCNFKPESLKTTFSHPANRSEVAFFLDPSHVMKLLRNHLESKREFMDKDDLKIKWNYIEELNKLREKEGLHLANKLTRKHINFKNNIMKVKLATQVFSESVAVAIKACREDLNLDVFKDSKATENFISNINIMFDIFNSRAMTQFDFKKPLCSQNKDTIFNFLDELKEYVLKLKIKCMSKRKVTKDGRVTYVLTVFYKRLVDAKCKTGFLGTLININSLKYLYAKLIGEKQLVFLPTYKLSQDHLEMLFSSIRMQGGFNDNPNVRQFKGCYKKLLAHLEVRCLTTGNCVPLEQIAVLNCSSAKNN